MGTSIRFSLEMHEIGSRNFRSVCALLDVDFLAESIVEEKIESEIFGKKRKLLCGAKDHARFFNFVNNCDFLSGAGNLENFSMRQEEEKVFSKFTVVEKGVVENFFVERTVRDLEKLKHVTKIIQIIEALMRINIFL
jgi:hypothetical protein